MKAFRIIYAAFLLLLTGCGQVANIRSLSTSYTPPDTGDTARIRIITDGLVRAVPGRDCLGWNTPGAGVMVSAKSGFPDHNGENLGIPGPVYSWAGAVSSELIIPANKPIALHYLGQLQHSRQCFKTMTFVPKKGVNYMIQASMSGDCSIQLDELTANNLRWTAVEPRPDEKLSMCNVMDNF